MNFITVGVEILHVPPMQVSVGIVGIDAFLCSEDGGKISKELSDWLEGTCNVSNSVQNNFSDGLSSHPVSAAVGVGIHVKLF